ncbi:MAG: hypothetical protein EOP49_09890 [Sphingobacteriales bacterium]|nr:MAG: hypothetical protein EOP49_09890 [Sphingobacteriales bacterium]
MTEQTYAPITEGATSFEETVAESPPATETRDEQQSPDDKAPIQTLADAETVEVWKPVVGYEGRYEVSSMGKVRSVPYTHPKTGNRLRGKILKTQINRDGYETFRALGKKNIRIHRAVAKAFQLNPHSLPLVNHKDGNKLNNRLSNLEWEDKRGNSQHAIRLGLIDTEHLHSLPSYRKDRITPETREKIISDCKSRKERGLSIANIASKYGVSTGSVSLISRNG